MKRKGAERAQTKSGTDTMASVREEEEEEEEEGGEEEDEELGKEEDMTSYTLEPTPTPVCGKAYNTFQS